MKDLISFFKIDDYHKVKTIETASEVNEVKAFKEDVVNLDLNESDSDDKDYEEF